MSTATVKVTGELVEDVPGVVELDVYDEANRPNGIGLRGIIAPKLPKASGELKDIIEGNRLVQRAVEPDDAEVTQGGGPETEEGETPGPQPEAEAGIGDLPPADEPRY